MESEAFSELVTSLMQRVFALVQACPPGRVTTYGWLAKAIGYPKGSRMVGWIMHEASGGVPAQRVINSKGELSGSWAFGERGKMRRLLEDEGVVFSANDRVDVKRYGWDPLRDLSEDERERIFAEAAALPVTVSRRLLLLLRTDAASPLRDQA
ncbi:methylated-DNA-protein-cysteine methyltransferase-like protein [Thermosporothrix hazakensis]|jgi:methylated-DNA-protein-cysteine methyltransferase-like protein|uniref:Methylated-DNA-protein-cysteine methyltransferase-like protein n=2 Tax=Thermosporothrix TaxID=768650 RepID=A0A326U7Z9_THEHA|nr:MGMT family protein [Thermosporothrix hazakensis]PZW27407.1 methylated-DNA-protein-cysteine methyltransferase-like protein [Thermosporothrix hazakensis]BBH85999.1 hypothetical protein KTC_07500 [Thermosporothrix sp. COM3]GCE45574.1 hypothetical protein KTH_04430 [Thermosporothrix hazakensis]